MLSIIIKWVHVSPITLLYLHHILQNIMWEYYRNILKKSIVQIVESEDYMYWIQCFDFLILEYKVQNSCNDLSPVFLRVPVAEYVFSRFLL